MAQTKRKRQTKHRGNAAGMIEARGRTSRPLSPEERKKTERLQSREQRLARRPTWKSAAGKSALAGALMFVFLLLVNKSGQGNRVVAAVVPAVLAVCLYMPASYYLELYMWRRRTGQAQGGLFGRPRKR